MGRYYLEMLCVKVDIKNAEKAKSVLIKKGFVNHNYSMFKKGEFFYIPISDENLDDFLKLKYEIVDVPEKDLVFRDGLNDFATEVKKILSSSELEHLNCAFDVVGNIAILEIDNELVSKEKEIAEVLLLTNKKIKTVVKKVGEHKGEFRLQDYKYLTGVENFEVISKENGVVLKLDIRKTYYSIRSSGERLRVCSQIKKGEKVLVMFSGVGIYGFVFSKHSQASKIVEVEINPDACKYANESLKLNKSIKNVSLYCRDVREFFKDSHLVFDRVVMPLPKTAGDFLDVAAKLVSKGGIINFYFFDSLDVISDNSKIKDLFSKHFNKFKILRVVKAGQQSPRVYRLCADIEIL